jgi:hypothetical protein
VITTVSVEAVNTPEPAVAYLTDTVIVPAAGVATLIVPPALAAAASATVFVVFVRNVEPDVCATNVEPVTVSSTSLVV